MKTKLIEVTNGPRNWGKMMVCRFDSEWSHESKISLGSPLLSACGWGPEHIVVVDLQTGEGAVFRPQGNAAADLEKHQVWVCPMFEPFLGWLYKQDLSDLDKLPDLVDLPDAEFLWLGHRRLGPVQKDLLKTLTLIAEQYATVLANDTVPEAARREAIDRNMLALTVAKSMCAAAGIKKDLMEGVVALIIENEKRSRTSNVGVQQG